MNDLSPNERIFVRQETKALPDLRSSAVQMAKAIATQSGMKLLDVYNALTRGDTDLLGDHLEYVVDFQDLMERVTMHRRVVMATAILKYRVIAEWTVEETQDANQLHPKLMEAIADFAQKEENGWVEQTEAEAVTEEDLEGKPEPEPEPEPKTVGELVMAN